MGGAGTAGSDGRLRRFVQRSLQRDAASALDPDTAGRISGLGWAAGYLGSVSLLILVYLGFISGTGEVRGLLHIPVRDGLNVRVAMLLAAAWLAILALPLLFVAHRLPNTGESSHPTSMLGGYRKLRADVAAEWRRDRNLVYFLLASAIFRDGLSAIFSFGAVLGVSVYGLSQGDVLMFGVAASTVAALGAVAGGFVDHRVGSKPVIIASLAAILAAAFTLMTLSGALAFWVCGLLLCLFIGPSQSSARALLLRMAQHGKGMAFGLYTMTGRAVAFLGPWLFSVFVDVFNAVRAGSRHLRGAVGRPADNAGRARAAPWRCGGDRTVLERGVADGQTDSGALTYLHAAHGDRAGDVVADVDDGDTGRAGGRPGQADLFTPGQCHIELGLDDVARIHVADTDGAAVTGDGVDNGLHGALAGRGSGRGNARFGGGGGRRGEAGAGRRGPLRRHRSARARRGHRRQGLDSGLALGGDVGDDQCDHQGNDQQHCCTGDEPQPPRRSRPFRWRCPGFGRFTGDGLSLLPIRGNCWVELASFGAQGE